MGKFTDTIKDLSAPITTGLGLLLEGHEDRRQVRQQEKLQKLQIAGQKEIADYNKSNQLDIWNKTNYEAQVEHLKNAGLNPALIYGQGGAGGTLGQGGASGVSGASASQGGGNEIGMALQLGLMKAQKENIEANTHKTNTEAENIGGVDRDLKEQQIADLIAGIQNKNATQGLIKAQTRIAELDGLLKDNTIQDQADILRWTAEKVEQEARQAMNETYISNQTKEVKIEMLRAELIGRYLQNELTKAQTQVDTQKIQSMKTEIVQHWESLRQGKQRVDVEQFAKEMQAKYPSMWNVVGKAMTDFFKGIGAKQYDTNNK